MHDRELLDSLEDKLQLVRDRVQGVAEGYSNGLVLWGEGGCGKSYTVEETLRRLGAEYKVTNSRVTSRGLFDLLRGWPDAVHVIEDAEPLMGDKHAEGVLRSALWGQVGRGGRQQRPVVWQTNKGREEFVFAGGVILVMNSTLPNSPPARAIKTRVTCLEFRPTNEEVAALMRQIASRGHRHGPHRLTPEECLEVAEEIIARSRRLQRHLDLRLLVNAFADRQQWADGAAETPWRELLDARMSERAVPAEEGGYETRAARTSREVALARRIAAWPREQRLAEWRRETGKSEKALYRRLQDAGSQFPQFPRWSDN